MKVLFVGDVVGKPGRAGLARAMPGLRERYAPDLVIVNGENSAGGLGITEKTANDLFSIGADVITLGNHAFRHRDVFEYLDHSDRIVRPANFMSGNPGRGHTIVEVAGVRVCVVNLIGQVQLRAARSPFTEADVILDRVDGRADVLFVDFHAEVTSEKVAMGWHLDGRVGAVVGTHTHVPTADARVLPQGTAFISDVGMTGSRASVLGVRWEQALESFRTQMAIRFQTAEDDLWINAVVVELGDDGLARSIEQVLEPAPD
ncbi:MAG TPA: TIGR00282 family metallophosphoesterase [Solirubrobacterales bacterium]|nr:TIGR00282 family metallophosphoesterase [Solirubrobacterales bacterium]